MGILIMTRFKNDPFLLKTRFESKCSSCNCSLPKGTKAYYWPSSRKVYCLSCGDADYRAFLQSAQDEEFYNSQYGQY